MNDILFINGSPHTDGHTAQLAKALLQGKTYDTLQLTDLKIYAYGQRFADDQYEEVMQAMSRFAALYGMDYQGMASSPREAAALASHI